MFGLDTKSLLIGMAIGYLVLPRVQAAVMSAGSSTS